MGKVKLQTGTEYLAASAPRRKSTDRMWADIGAEKTELPKDWGFDIVGWRYVKPGRMQPWILEFDYVRDTPLAQLRVELVRLQPKE